MTTTLKRTGPLTLSIAVASSLLSGLAVAPAQATLSPSENPESEFYVSDEEEQLFLERSAKEFEQLEREGEIQLQDGTTEEFTLDELIDQMEEAEALVQDGPAGEPTELSPEPDQVTNAAIAPASLAVSATAPSLQVQAVKWSWESFGKCTAEGLGVKAA